MCHPLVADNALRKLYKNIIVIVIKRETTKNPTKQNLDQDVGLTQFMPASTTGRNSNAMAFLLPLKVCGIVWTRGQ